MKIRKLTIRNFCGIRELSTEIPPAGAIATGGNAKGKTSWLRAIQAALLAEGLGPDAIRVGADRAEILLDVDELHVRRAITAKGNTLQVKSEAGDVVWTKPQARLKEIVGANLDPLSFFLGGPYERRKQILAAMPCYVTAEDLLRWTGDEWLPEEGRHGLEVIADVRQHYYDDRTEANRRVREANETAAASAQAAAAQKALVHPDAVIPETPAERDGDELASLDRKLAQLRSQAEAAAKYQERTSGTRGTISTLEAEAMLLEDGAGEPPSDDEIRIATTKIGELREQLEQARAALQLLEDRRKRHARSCADAQAKRQVIVGLRRSLDETAIEAPAEGVIEAADKEVATAIMLLGRTQQARKAAAAAAKAETDRQAAEILAASAKRLDELVDKLTREAPAELVSGPNVIPGLEISDTIKLDGVALDRLSGAEALAFSVKLAKRASQAKILVVDGLERLDPAHMRQFVEMACKDDWQLLATRVSDGELQIEAIELVGANG